MKKCQGGFISWQVAMLIVVVGFTATVGLKLMPHYIDNRYIKVALKNLARDNPNLERMTNQQINKELQMFMTTNGVRGQEAQSFKISRRSGTLYVDNVYEVRVPMFSNIDVILNFKLQLSSSNPELCCRYLVDTTEIKQPNE